VRLVLVLVAALTLAAGAQQDKLSDCWAKLSRIQAFVEYFYMETGIYPASLDDLEKILNDQAPQKSRLIKLPVDPATNKPFRFLLEKDGKRYQLTVPDAAAYGGKAPTLGNVDWAFLSLLAEKRRFEQVVLQSASMLKAVAAACEMYAKDHNKQYPTSLDDLMPKYLQRIPSDPLTGKNLVYKKTVDGYQIVNPNADKYMLKSFLYDSSSGLKVEQLDTRKAPQPGGAPAAEPSPAPSSTE